MKVEPVLPAMHSRVAWVFGDDFDIDQIIGVENIKVQDLDVLSKVAMNGFDPDFAASLSPGDVLVGGRNFGYGHPHAAAMRTMRHLGIKAVIAESFFSSYWIGEIGYGFTQVICPGISKKVERFDQVEIDFTALVLRVVRTNEELPIMPYSKRDVRILMAGGLKNVLAEENTTNTSK
ncbi:3-isopropylmalate dehydratase [Paraburkholderia sp. BCC1884]|uniref:3-isopropylmalate dehydratase n=1 Tax=Paraburkholderia sp. BCC1884 TaxID=2562668 RepID=UPI001182E69F|nr:3-isopropylmalate dehydratase [Paraburkholderia sp. BCC1884]